jgi:hypothetical protein
MLRVTLWALVAAMTAGCLGNTHVIPRGELQSLAQQDPQTRGERVHVVQQFVAADDPPAADPVQGGFHAGVHVSVPVHVGPTRHSHPRNPPPPSVDPPGPKSSSSAPAKASADDAYVWVIAAAAAAVVLAATEGVRFNGWVRMHPMHPVHLYGPGGVYEGSVPLAYLDPDTAAWADRAVVRDSEGPWQRLRRAPLDRRGLNYSLILGVAELPSGYDATIGEAEERGFLAHIQLGYFPDTRLGFLLDIGLGWRDNLMDETLFDSRWALEGQFFPVAAGRLHAGLFGQLGFGGRLEDGPQERSFSRLLGGGGLLQLELTTYMAITARAGLTSIHGFTSSDVGLGISIY